MGQKDSTPGTRRPAENTSHKSSYPRVTEFTEKAPFCDLHHYRDEKYLISGYEIVIISHISAPVPPAMESFAQLQNNRLSGEVVKWYEELTQQQREGWGSLVHSH